MLYWRLCYVAFQFSNLWISLPILVAEHQGQRLKIRDAPYANATVFHQVTCRWRVATVFNITSVAPSERGSTGDVRNMQKPADFHSLTVFVPTSELSLSARGRLRHVLHLCPAPVSRSADAREWWSDSTCSTSMTDLLSDRLSSQWIIRQQNLILEGCFSF